jgi:hypothetical protein
MTSEEAIGHMIDALNVLAVPHMVVGSLASNFHGVARSTQDADIVIQLGSTSVTALADQLGAEFVLDPQMSFETATGTIRHTIRVKAIAFLIELFHLSDDPYDQARFQRRRPVRLLEHDTHVLTAEDVIVTKLRWALHGQRQKDKDDVRNVIAVQRDRLDWPYVENWCRQHGTMDLLLQARGSPSS